MYNYINMNKSLKKYSNIFKQIKDCKYPDITIEIDDYPLYNRSNIHIIIRSKVILGIANM